MVAHRYAKFLCSGPKLRLNAHVFCATPQYLKALNGPYMRVLRRVVGDPNFGHAKYCDKEVRRLLGRPLPPLLRSPPGNLPAVAPAG